MQLFAVLERLFIKKNRSEIETKANFRENQKGIETKFYLQWEYCIDIELDLELKIRGDLYLFCREYRVNFLFSMPSKHGVEWPYTAK
jgi:hypothetical protein